MRRLLGYFARGLVLLAPLAVTVWVCWIVFRSVDGWLGLPIPGAGFVATLALITLFGFLGSNLLTRSAVSALEAVMARLPFVRLLYGSTKDLLNAFVGEKRRFDKPVIVSLTADHRVRLLGFVTQESLAHLGLTEQVAVYCPQQGWVEFDPTNNVIPDTQHILLGWGRDFGDVSPLRGVILGGGAHQPHVAVTVEEEN